METSINFRELPLSYLFMALGLLLLLWASAFFALRTSRPPRDNGDGKERERDWSIPAIDSQAALESPFHRWDPRMKIVSLLFFIFCMASISRIEIACAALLISVASVAAARIPFRYPLKRLAAMGAFLGMFLVVMPITAPAKSGDTLFVFTSATFVSFNLRGFLLALLICLKASAIAIMVEPLLSTSPFSATIHALASLKVPSAVCQMILLSHRYIYVFRHEASRMSKGMAARGFKKETSLDTLKAMGNFLGMILVRSFERTERVHDAMLARGYDGSIRGQKELHARRSDWLKAGAWMFGGILLLAVDRFWGALLARFL